MTEQQSSGNQGDNGKVVVEIEVHYGKVVVEMEGQSSIKHVVEMNLLECSDELTKKVEESDVHH
jgi:hypothetical protein